MRLNPPLKMASTLPMFPPSLPKMSLTAASMHSKHTCLVSLAYSPGTWPRNSSSRWPTTRVFSNSRRKQVDNTQECLLEAECHPNILLLLKQFVCGSFNGWLYQRGRCLWPWCFLFCGVPFLFYSSSSTFAIYDSDALPASAVWYPFTNIMQLPLHDTPCSLKWSHSSGTTLNLPLTTLMVVLCYLLEPGHHPFSLYTQSSSVSWHKNIGEKANILKDKAGYVEKWQRRVRQKKSYLSWC